VVDAQDNPYSNIDTQKFYEVQKYLMVTDHGYHGYVLIANRKFWDGLPPDIRKIMDGVVNDTTAYFEEVAKKDDAEAKAHILATKKIQLIELTPDEKRAMKKAMLKVHRDFEGKIGKSTIESIYQATGFDPNKL
jgi:C4-dicarboxylate-binding protein DctP